MTTTQTESTIPYSSCEPKDVLLWFQHPEQFKVIAIDTETNGEDIRDGRGFALGLSAATALGEPGPSNNPMVLAGYVPVRNPSVESLISENVEADFLAQLKDAIESYTGVIVFFNAKFDLESLRTLGIDYRGKYVDMMLICHLINENRPFKKDLTNCSNLYLNGASKKEGPQFQLFLSLYGWGGLPAPVVREYAEYDAVLTIMLYIRLWPTVEAEEIVDYWFNHKMRFLRVVMAMERRGVRMDVPMCIKMTALGQSIMEDVKELLGGRNPGSSKDLKYLLIDKMGLPVVKTSPKTGAPSFDKSAMEIYDQILEQRDDETAQLILTYRGWQKAVSSNYIPYVELLSTDGRLRPNYKLHGTKTGRMSCEKPNLQQIPRSGDKPWNGDMKSAFLPADGYTLWEADYGQLEFRLGSAYGKERALLEIFNSGRDIFDEMAASLGMARQDVKTLTYTIQYGGGINRISQVFGVSKDRAQSIRDNFYTTYPGLRAVSNLAGQKAKHLGKVRIWSKRYRHFQYPRDEAHKAFNSVIQGGAADVVEATMIRLFEQVDNEDECRMLLTVHDSVIFEIKDGLESKYHPMIKEVMENVEPDFGVRFKVDLHKFGE